MDCYKFNLNIQLFPLFQILIPNIESSFSYISWIVEFLMIDYSKYSDQELTVLLVKGDKAAFAFIYNNYKASLYLHALRTLKDEEEATDLVQEVFTNLWEKREVFSLKTSLDSYLYGAIRNRVFNAIAHQKITSQYASSLQSFLDKGEFITDDLIREKELTAIIDKEIALLPEKMREVFLLSRNTDLSYKKIGEHLNISDKTVKKQVGNAVRILREKINGSVSIFFLFF